MIGGATTSKAHTSVKIDPQYDRDVIVYVPDASRSVAVATQLMGTSKAAFVEKFQQDYEEKTNNERENLYEVTYLLPIVLKDHEESFNIIYRSCKIIMELDTETYAQCSSSIETTGCFQASECAMNEAFRNWLSRTLPVWPFAEISLMFHRGFLTTGQSSRPQPTLTSNISGKSKLMV